tara:strand:+ start:133 stop:342 length:210 start_codon:yes stop_codon:yes gene_type:complete
MLKDTKVDLLQIIRNLTKKIEILEDENEALWQMLDEIHESDTAAKRLMDEQRDELLARSLKDMKPIGEA